LQTRIADKIFEKNLFCPLLRKLG